MSGPVSAPAVAFDANESQRRFQHLVNVLKMGGANGLEKLEEEVKKLPSNPVGWRDGDRLLRKLETLGVEERLRELMMTSSLRAADRLGRIVPAFEPHALALGSTVKARPTLQLRLAEVKMMWTKLAERCDDEAQWLKDTPAANFYFLAKADYLHSATR